MKTHTAWTYAFACAAALACGSVNAAPNDHSSACADAQPGAERGQLRALMTDYGLPSARELARDITRDIVSSRSNQPRLMASFTPLRVDSAQAKTTLRASQPAVSAAESVSRDAESAPSRTLSRIQGVLRKITGILQLGR